MQNDPVNFVDPSGLDGETFPINCIGTNCSMVGTLIVNSTPGNSTSGGRSGVGSLLGDAMIEVVDGDVDFPGGGLLGGLIPWPPPSQQTLREIKRSICGAIPSGRTLGASGALGLLGGPTGGGEFVINYDSGQLSAFAFGGAQVGWNGGASGSLNSGFVWGLNDSNSNYSGGFTGVNGGAGFGGFASASSGGLTGGGGGLIPNPRSVAVVGGSVGGSLLGGVSFGGYGYTLH